MTHWAPLQTCVSIILNSYFALLMRKCRCVFPNTQRGNIRCLLPITHGKTYTVPHYSTQSAQYSFSIRCLLTYQDGYLYNKFYTQIKIWQYACVTFYSTQIANQCIADMVGYLERPFAFLTKKKNLDFVQTYIHLSLQYLFQKQILVNLGQL